MKFPRIIATAVVLAAAFTPVVQGAPPIALNASTAGNDPQVWRTHARIRAYVSTAPDALLVSQLRPDNWDVALEGRWAIILPTRGMDAGGGCKWDDWNAGHIVQTPDGGPRFRPSGEPNCSFTPEYLYDSAAQRLQYDPAYIVVDELASETVGPVTDFVAYAEKRAREGDGDAVKVLDRLAFYANAVDTVKPHFYPIYLRRWLARTKAPVYGELYGGEMSQVARKDRPALQNGRMVRARLKGNAIRWMRRIGWNVRPMLAGAPRYVGTGRASILNLRQRMRFVRLATGMQPAIWKLNGVIPSEAGLGYMVTRELSIKVRK